MNLLVFLKNWTLPLAMLAGVVSYFVFSRLSVLAVWKPWVTEGVSLLTPALIFAQLLLIFCKMEPRELTPKGWHVWLLLIQVLSSGLLSLVLLLCPLGESARICGEAAVVCLICPTATAAAVITGKLGGSASTLTTYTLLSNILAACAVPLVFPLVENHADLTFTAAFLKILGKVFPLLLVPFFLALLLRYFLPVIHRWLLKYHSLAFYIWAVALTLVMGQTTRSLVQASVSWQVELGLAIVGLLACAVQFYAGKCIGSVYDDRISAGQALGQKNTVLAIWMAVTYLNPVSSLGPGSYVVWQNLFNAWQLWKQRQQAS